MAGGIELGTFCTNNNNHGGSEGGLAKCDSLASVLESDPERIGCLERSHDTRVLQQFIE